MKGLDWGAAVSEMVGLGGRGGRTYGQFRRDISARESTIVVVLGQGREGG